jgi:uncharacterized protein YuzB (UPF0349 family)
MAHTPGPWAVEWSEEWGGDGVTVAASEGPVAFRVLEYDAALIAAAPELLAVCKNIAGDMQAILDGDDFSGMSDAELFGVMLRSLNAAISKAEGRE